MRSDVLHIGMLLSQKIGLSIFSLQYKSTGYLKCKKIIKSIETETYGDGGIHEFENNCDNEFKRLLLRSFAQYKSNMHCDVNRFFLLIKQVLFLLFLVYLSLAIIIRGLVDCTKRIKKEDTDVVIFHQYSYIMNLVKDLYAGRRRVFLEVSGQRFSYDDLTFVICCIRILPKIVLHPWFLFSLVKWVSYYSYIVSHYEPKVLVNFLEGSFVSSIMTHYLRQKKILHVNHMHGEIYFSPRFAFAEFDDFHVYGEHWKNLYEEMFCKAHFIIAGNAYHNYLYSLRNSASNNREKNSILIVHTSLMQLEANDYDMLLNFLSALSNEWKIYFRYHPQEKLHGMKYFNKLKKDIDRYPKCHIDFDKLQSETIEKSLMAYETVVGKSSAAMLEAWIAGCKVVYLGESDELKSRYGNSSNILYVSELTSNDVIKKFLNTPLLDDDKETSLINHVSKMVCNR